MAVQIWPVMAFLFASGLLTAPVVHAQTVDVSTKQVTRVDTRNGPIQGALNSTTVAYLGIPFAEPPVGELRWRAPKPHRSWKGVRDASQFGKHCVQADPKFNRAGESEDCLFLNVYVPRALAEGRSRGSDMRKPVMVWIYGGANVEGASEFYDPTPLVQSGEVVAVTVNYRLGVFGFLAHPALYPDGRVETNFGILDQQLALKWVRENIDRFGGDARNVTIFGESAGGWNVTTHLASPLSAGLFDKAIIMSGAFLDTPSLADSEALGAKLAERAGCKERAGKCLRALSVAQVLAHAGDLAKGTAAYSLLIVDGRVLTETQRSAFAKGKFNRVPVMQGNTSDEGLGMLFEKKSDAERRKELENAVNKLRKDPAKAFAIYSKERYSSVAAAASAAAGDRMFACPAQVSNRLLSKWVPTYAYEFADPHSSEIGPTHGAELKYLFNVKLGVDAPQFKPIEGEPGDLPVNSRKLSESMRLAWVEFAKSGHPRSAGIPEWPPASKGILILKPVPTVAPNSDFAERHNCAFWN